MKKIIKYSFFGFIGLSLLAGLFSVFSGNKENKPVLDLKKEKESQLNTIAFRSEQKIIDNLKDPSSFEIIDKSYIFLNDSIYEVKIKYSGTNGFGARIQNQYLKTGVLKYNASDTSFTEIVKFEK